MPRQNDASKVIKLSSEKTIPKKTLNAEDTNDSKHKSLCEVILKGTRKQCITVPEVPPTTTNGNVVARYVLRVDAEELHLCAVSLCGGLNHFRRAIYHLKPRATMVLTTLNIESHRSTLTINHTIRSMISSVSDFPWAINT